MSTAWDVDQLIAGIDGQMGSFDQQLGQCATAPASLVTAWQGFKQQYQVAKAQWIAMKMAVLNPIDFIRLELSLSDELAIFNGMSLRMATWWTTLKAACPGTVVPPSLPTPTPPPPTPPTPSIGSVDWAAVLKWGSIGIGIVGTLYVIKETGILSTVRAVLPHAEKAA